MSDAEGETIFYREAGRADAPVLLLLHGFPSSSFMYRELIPLLANEFRVTAPDYPGFGQGSFPSPRRFTYTFERLTQLMDTFTTSSAVRSQQSRLRKRASSDQRDRP